MRSQFSRLYDYVRSNLPLVVVIVVALTIAVTNIDFQTYYSGWDNIHAEFNLSRYFNQVFFGAWLEHQGLGAPAGQAHLAEIPRLPILFALKLLLPDNLVRYVFIFSMYLIGGIGAYSYLKQIWLNDKTGPFKDWIASLGAAFYLLHILTLQQFYISFEMFTVQFAFLPFLLLTLHRLLKNRSAKNLLYFVLVQLLIAPSAHTPTVFYLAVMFSLIYAFFLALKKGFLKAVWFSFLIGLLTFAANAYWILPNLYYSFNNAHYVQGSRDNTLFATESLWSIREAGSFSSFTSNMHYLFNWKDYSFADYRHEFIFNEWLPHLSQSLTVSLMTFLGLLTVFGIPTAALAKHKGKKRWAFIVFYFFAAALIWVNIFPTKPIADWLYQSEFFLEAFRNPFTKLSILYSFVLLIFFVSFIEFLIQTLHKKTDLIITGKKAGIAILAIGFFTLSFISLPAFRGHFISEKLRIKYPDQYQRLFSYLDSRNKNLRLLQLPQFSHAGWVLHDWNFIEQGNGYQGIDFNFFGFSQPMMNRDSDRWVETSDFFYHQLKYALDKQDPEQFSQLLEKFNIDLILIDETKISAARNHDYSLDHSMAEAAGFKLSWSQDFLYVYEKPPLQTSQILVPKEINWVTAAKEGRIRQDYIYQETGDYVLADEDQSDQIYPFLDLMTVRADNVFFSDERVEVVRKFKQGDYLLNLDGLQQVYYQTPAEITYNQGRVEVSFPKNRILSNQQVITLPQVYDFDFSLAEEENYPEIILFFNDQGVLLDQDKPAHPLLTMEIGQPVEIQYAQKPAQLQFNQDLKLNASDLNMQEALTLEPDWTRWWEDIRVELQQADSLTWQMDFPLLNIDLLQSPSENCERPERGLIEREVEPNGDVIYRADDYAVNCNGYSFDYVSSSYPSVLKVSGSGSRGRGTKLFVSYTAKEVVSESYMLPENNFDVYLTLHPVTNDPRSQFVLNWETRSFGNLSENLLSSMQLAPIPLNRAAQVVLVDRAGIEPTENEIEIIRERSPASFLHLVEYQCLSDTCYLGLDQTYDDLWLGLKLEERKLMPHLRLNNWANLWQTSGSGHLLIFYLPEFVSLTSLFLLSGGVMVLIVQYLRSKD